jgi:hypothetical protein
MYWCWNATAPMSLLLSALSDRGLREYPLDCFEQIVGMLRVYGVRGFWNLLLSWS